ISVSLRHEDVHLGRLGGDDLHIQGFFTQVDHAPVRLVNANCRQLPIHLTRQSKSDFPYLGLHALAVDKLKRGKKRVKHDGRLLARSSFTENDGVDLALDLHDAALALEDVETLLELRLVYHDVLVALVVLLVGFGAGFGLAGLGWVDLNGAGPCRSAGFLWVF
ncbi:hypothetical protein EGW08_003359, partial [Elysia chlorotica]